MSTHHITESSISLGCQTFDGLGRQLTVDVGGRVTRFHYQSDQLPPCANTLADGKRIDFTYEPALDQQLLCIQPVGEPANSFTYDQRLALTASASGPLGTQQMSYTASGKPASDTWSVDGRDHSTTWRHSLGGLLLGFVDANDADHVYHYDTLGRLENVVVGKVTTHTLSLKPNYKTFNWPTRDRMDGEPRFFSNNAKSVPAQFSVFWPSRRA